MLVQDRSAAPTVQVQQVAAGLVGFEYAWIAHRRLPRFFASSFSFAPQNGQNVAIILTGVFRLPSMRSVRNSRNRLPLNEYAICNAVPSFASRLSTCFQQEHVPFLNCRLIARTSFTHTFVSFQHAYTLHSTGAVESSNPRRPIHD